MTVASTSTHAPTLHIAPSLKILAPLASHAVSAPALNTAKLGAVVNSAASVSTKVLEAKVGALAAAAKTVVAVKVAEVKELSVPVAQTQSATLSESATLAQKAAAALKPITTPDELHINTNVHVPVQKVVAAAADVAGKVAVDLSWVSVQTTDSSVKETSKLTLGDKLLAGFEDKGLTVPGIDKISSPVAGIDGKVLVNAVAGGLHDINVPVKYDNKLDYSTPAQKLVVSTPEVALVKTVTASLGDVKVGTPQGEKSLGGSTLGGDIKPEVEAVLAGKTLLAQEIKPVHVNPEPVKVGALAAELTAKVAVTAEAVAQATLPTLKTPALTAHVPGAEHVVVDKTIATHDITLKAPTDKLVAHVDLQAINAVSGLAYVEGLPSGDKGAALSSDVLAVSKLVAAVGVTHINPGVHISGAELDLHAALPGSYELAPAMTLSPYAGHTQDPAGANASAWADEDIDHAGFITLVGTGTSSPVHYG